MYVYVSDSQHSSSLLDKSLDRYLKGGLNNGAMTMDQLLSMSEVELHTTTMTILRSLRYTLIATLLTSHLVLGTALTAILNAHERSCYYADVDGVGEKIGVSPPSSPARPVGEELMAGFYFAVQSGGDFEVDYTVMDPDDKVLLEGVNERQGDYIFTANKVCPHASGSAVPGWSKM
jgi:hypothetical protein